MKRLILTLVLSISLISCNSQGKKENKMTTDERLSYISGKIKKYDYEPLY